MEKEECGVIKFDQYGIRIIDEDKLAVMDKTAKGEKHF